MATKRMLAREVRRKSKSTKAKKKRDEIRNKIKDAIVSAEEKQALIYTLSEMLRDESKIRIRNRCALCGRSRGVYRKFRLCRCCLRKAAMNGEIPGLIKSSW